MTKSANVIDRHVGGRVRMRRLMLGWTQERLADALGISFQQVQKYERGTNRIGASRLQLIAQSLNVTPSFFFEGSADEARQAQPGFAEESDDVIDFMSTVEGLQLNRAFASIKDPKVRKRIVDLVMTLAKDHTGDGAID